MDWNVSLPEMVTLDCFKKSFLVWMGSVVIGAWFTRELIKIKQTNKQPKIGLDVPLYVFPGGNTKSVRALHSVMTLSLMTAIKA